MADVYNTEFRDKAAVASYPLDPGARQTLMPEALLLDASIYIPSVYTPPFFFIKISGEVSDSRVKFVVADARRLEVCSAFCSYEDGSAPFRDEYGRAVGVLVYDSDEMEAFRGSIGARIEEFILADTQLQSEVCRFYDVKAMHTVVAARNSLTNRVNIDFVAGAHRDQDRKVHVYGEQSDLGRPVTSINRVPCKHAFLLSHVHSDYVDESALRLETASGVIKVGKSRDF